MINFFRWIGFGVLIVGVIGMIVSDSDDKKQWEELTNMGERPLVEINL